MRIAIDISAIQYQGTGVGRYIDALSRALVSADSHNFFHFVYVSWGNPLKKSSLFQSLNGSKNIRFHELRLPEKIAHTLWNSWGTFHIERITGALDVFFFGDWYTQPTWARGYTTVHDCAFRRYPETIDPYVLKTQENRMKFIQEHNIKVFADSYATKKDIEHYYPTVSVKVIYPGIEVTKVTDYVVNQTLATYGLRRGEYVISVGKREPRKNLDRLCNAWQKAKKGRNELVLVGPQGWGKQRFEGVRTLGFVSDEALHALYQGSLGLSMVSLYEGFGFPVGEAMALGVPVCVSNCSSLPEIAGDAGVYVNPHDIESIAQGLHTLQHENLEKNIHKGRSLVKSFSWSRTAKNVLESLS